MSDDHSSAAPKVGIVIPCYRSTSSLPQLARRLTDALDAQGMSHELLFIDDASPDRSTWKTLESVQAAFPGTVRCIRLARNVGQHNAIQCGLAQLSSSVEIVVTMDDDLQHRPEDAPALIHAVEQGADIAIGSYDAKLHSRWRNLGGALVDYSLRKLFRLPSDFQLTSYRAFRRFAADDVIDNHSRYSYLTAALLAVTRFRTNVPVSHDARHDGRSGYSLVNSLELAANLFLSYSRWPLYLVVALFALSVLATMSITGWAFWRWMVADHPPAGWTSTMMMLGVCNTLNLAALAVIALLSTRSHRQLVGSSNRWRVAEHL